MTQSDLTSFAFKIENIAIGDDSYPEENVSRIESNMKTMNTTQFLELDNRQLNTFHLSFEVLEVSLVVVIVRSVVKVEAQLILQNDTETLCTTSIVSQSSNRTVGSGGFFKHVLKNQDAGKEPFNQCIIRLTSDSNKLDYNMAPACATIMLRGAKNQLSRGVELRGRTKLGLTGAVTTSAKKSVQKQLAHRSSQNSDHPQQQSQSQRTSSQMDEQQKPRRLSFSNTDALQAEAAYAAQDQQLDQIMEEEEVKQDEEPLAKHQTFITPNKNNMAASSSATTPHGMQRQKALLSNNGSTPVLQLNVYNQERVDGASQAFAISIKDSDIAQKVAAQNRTASANSSKPSSTSKEQLQNYSESNQDSTSQQQAQQQINTNDQQQTNGNISSRQQRINQRQEKKQGKQPSPPAGTGELSSTQVSKGRIRPEPVDLTAEQRKHLELEAAMVYYRQMIDLKLRKGEEIQDDDEVVLRFQQAIEAYEKYLEPSLSVEQIADLANL